MWGRGVFSRRFAAAMVCTWFGAVGAAGADPIAPPWTAQDVGAPAPAGTSSTDPVSGVFTVNVGGFISGSTDQFHFIYQQVSGDLDISVRVDSIADANAWSKAGVMIRSSLDPASPNAFALVSAAHGAAFQRRARSGGDTSRTTSSGVAAPAWVRLVRSGTTVTAYWSSSGTSWTQIGSATLSLGANVYVGLAVASQTSSLSTTAQLSQVSMAGPLPAPQQQADIGAPPIAGSASYQSGTYQITASGADIWGTSDQFHYVYQPVTGDLDVSARVVSIGAADPWSKSGVMVRQSLDANAAYAYTLVSASSGCALLSRRAAGATSNDDASASGSAPRWVRLKRTADLFEAFVSTDGQNWTSMGSDTVPMTGTVYVGLAVTSHSTSATTTSSVDSFSLTQTQSGNQPPSVTLTSPSNGATFTAPATISLAATASDPEGQLARVEFYNGSTLIGTTSTPPYAATWSNVVAGTYALKAVAYDTAGASASSAVATVTVSAVGRDRKSVV